MAYTPVAQRAGGTGGYKPIGQRSILDAGKPAPDLAAPQNKLQLHTPASGILPNTPAPQRVRADDWGKMDLMTPGPQPQVPENSTIVKPATDALRDVARLSITRQTAGVIDAANSFAKEVGRAMARAYATTGQSVAKNLKLAEGDEVDPRTFFGNSTFAAALGETVFGRNKPFTAASEDVDFINTFAPEGTSVEEGDLAVGGGAITMMLSALDLTGAGGATKGIAGAVRSAKAVKTAEEGLQFGKALGLNDDLAKQYSKLWVGVKTDAQAKLALEKAAKAQSDFEFGPIGKKGEVDNLTKNEMIAAIDYIRLKKPYDQAMEESIGRLAEKHGITTSSMATVAKKFEDLVEKAPTVDVVPKVVKKKTEPIKRADNISEEEKFIEDDAIRAVEENEEAMIDDYIQKNGNLINTDEARELFPAYAENRARSSAVHEPASHLTKRVYEKMLDTRKGAGNNTVLFTSGGTGAGKSFALRSLGEHLDEFPIVYDTNMNTLDSSIKKIDQALEAGFNVDLRFIHNDIFKALDNALDRAERMKKEKGSGRTVPLKAHIETHLGSPRVVERLLKKYADEPRVAIGGIDNSGDTVKKIDDIVDFTKEKGYSDRYEELSGKLAERIKARLKDGSISRETADGFLGRKDVRRRDGGINESRVTRKPQEVDPEEISSLDETARREAGDDIEGRPLGPRLKQAGRELEEARIEKEILKDTTREMPGRQLMKYQSPATGELPEFTGKPMRRSDNTGKMGRNSEFGRRGDQIAEEVLGYQDIGWRSVEEAQEALDAYKASRTHLKAAAENYSAKLKKYRGMRAVYNEVLAYVKAETRGRRETMKAVQDFFKLDSGEVQSILRKERDFRLMGDQEFDDFMKRFEGLALEHAHRRDLMIDLQATIHEKELKKVENIRRVMKLPKIENMSTGQLDEFNQFLDSFKQGDEFLSVRKLETVRHTDLKGIHTRREAQERLLAQVNKERAAKGLDPKTLEELQQISVGKFDLMRGDVTLARQNPFYELMVKETHEAFLNADKLVLDAKDRINDLFNAARKSRRRGFLDRAIPTDNLIFRWLSATDADKLRYAEDMTREELEAAMYVRESYAEMRDYLVQQKVLKRFKNDYITHIRRGFLEAWKEGDEAVAGTISGTKPKGVKRVAKGLLAAFREMFSKYKQDEAFFNILNSRTGEILPLEKFFQFSMTRSGELIPSKNVAKAYLTYLSSFEKKRALDSIVPKLDIYVHSLTPQKLTPRGLEFDASLKKFFKSWMNTKKGRPVSIPLIEPGGLVDWGLRSGVALTRLLDLGLNVPVGIASNFGAQAGAFRGLGTKKYAKGVARLSTKKGREITKQYANLVGEPITAKFTDAGSDVGDKFVAIFYGLFSAASRRAHQVFLLGGMTDAEWAAGALSTKRMADLKLEMGRQLPQSGFDSVVGKTAPGNMMRQYKSWALPLLTSTAEDLAKLGTAIKKGDIAFAKSPEAQELMRTTVISAAVGLSAYGFTQANSDSKDRNFAEEIAFKAARDALSLIGALDPQLWTSEPRLVSFISELGTALHQIIVVDRTKDGAMKGPAALQRTLTPAPVKAIAKQIAGEPAPEGLPQLPKLPKLPTLPKLPKI